MSRCRRRENLGNRSQIANKNVCGSRVGNPKYVIRARILSEAHRRRLSNFKCSLVYLYPDGLKSLYSVLNRKIRSVVRRHLCLRLKYNVCTQIEIDGIIILLRKIFWRYKDGIGNLFEI